MITTNIIVSMDDEPCWMAQPDWDTLVEGIHSIVEDHRKLSQATEPTYTFEARGHVRVALVKSRVMRKYLKDIVNLVQELLRDLDRSVRKTSDRTVMVSFHHTDFNESLIVSKDSSEPWETFIQAK